MEKVKLNYVDASPKVKSDGGPKVRRSKLYKMDLYIKEKCRQNLRDEAEYLEKTDGIVKSKKLI